MRQRIHAKWSRHIKKKRECAGDLQEHAHEGDEDEACVPRTGTAAHEQRTHHAAYRLHLQ